MASVEYRELGATVGLLRRHLLPQRFDPTGNYRERAFTGVVSFRLLCHAAIEEYLESRVIMVAVKSSAAMKAGKMSHAAACLLSFSETHFGLPPDTLSAPQPTQSKVWPEKIDIKERSRLTSSSFVASVRSDNHGIRERNILRLLLPVGFDINKIDPVLLAELDSFGQSRGQFAHSSARAHIKNKPDPKTEYERVKKIVQLLQAVDVEIDHILKAIPKAS